MKRLLWDYYGGDAEGTAGHFLVHLADYLARNGLADARRGVLSERPGHGAAWVDVPEAAVEGLIQALRPKRMGDAPD